MNKFTFEELRECTYFMYDDEAYFKIKIPWKGFDFNAVNLTTGDMTYFGKPVIVERLV